MVIRDQGARNGVDDLELISPPSPSRWSKTSLCRRIASPSSGIIDSHQYMLALQGDANQTDAASCCARPC